MGFLVGKRRPGVSSQGWKPQDDGQEVRRLLGVLVSCLQFGDMCAGARPLRGPGRGRCLGSPRPAWGRAGGQSKDPWKRPSHSLYGWRASAEGRELLGGDGGGESELGPALPDLGSQRGWGRGGMSPRPQRGSLLSPSLAFCTCQVEATISAHLLGP